MWIYVHELATAINMTEVYSMHPVYVNAHWNLVIKYKDIDGKKAEHTIEVGDGGTIKRIAKELLAQLKEVSNAQVSTELENALLRNGTDG